MTWMILCLPNAFHDIHDSFDLPFYTSIFWYSSFSFYLLVLLLLFVAVTVIITWFISANRTRGHSIQLRRSHGVFLWHLPCFWNSTSWRVTCWLWKECKNIPLRSSSWTELDVDFGVSAAEVTRGVWIPELVIYKMNKKFRRYRNPFLYTHLVVRLRVFEDSCFQVTIVKAYLHVC